MIRCLCFVCVIVLFLPTSELTAQGVVREWDDEGETSNWSEAANWTDDGVPGNMDTANIGSLPDAYDDLVVLDVNADVVRDLILQNGADLDLNAGRLVMSVDVSVGAGAALGTSISELVVRKRNAIGSAAFAIDANSLAIGANGKLALIDGGQIELDGTGPQPGVLSVADGGVVQGYGLIDLSDTDASLGSLTSLLINDGAIVVEDPLGAEPGEPAAVQLHISASRAPMFARLDLGGVGGTGIVSVARNATLMIDPAFLGPNRLTLSANSTFVMQSDGAIADGQTIEVNSGIQDPGGASELPAAPAIISGDGVLSVSGFVGLDEADEELIVETEFDGIAGVVTNRGIVRFRGGGNIRAIELNALDNGAVVNESTAALKFQGGQAYDTPLLNAGLMSIVEFGGGDGTVQFNDFQQTMDGTLSLSIGGNLPGEFDVLNVADNAVLDGTLRVSLTDMFEPVLGESYTILNSLAGSVAGTFEITDFPVFGGLTFDVVYDTTSVALQVVATSVDDGDFDDDGDVDGADFLLWQTGGSSDPLSAEDLATWQAIYNPIGIEAVSAAAIPEPTSSAIVALALIFTQLGRTRLQNERLSR